MCRLTRPYVGLIEAVRGARGSSYGSNHDRRFQMFQSARKHMRSIATLGVAAALVVGGVAVGAGQLAGRLAGPGPGRGKMAPRASASRYPDAKTSPTPSCTSSTSGQAQVVRRRPGQDHRGRRQLDHPDRERWQRSDDRRSTTTPRSLRRAGHVTDASPTSKSGQQVARLPAPRAATRSRSWCCQEARDGAIQRRSSGRDGAARARHSLHEQAERSCGGTVGDAAASHSRGCSDERLGA